MNVRSRSKDLETIPLRYVCDLYPSVSFDEFDEHEDVTFLPMDRVKAGYFIPNTEKFSKYASSYNAFEDGDIILAKVTPCFENGNIAIARDLIRGKGFGSSELFVIRPTGVDRRFLFYYFQSSQFKQDGEASMTGAGGLKRVSPDILRKHHIPSPSLESQRFIADYLDRETARIDRLIVEKERMLALLEEKRAALVSDFVTRGLDSRASFRPSGQEWLGEIPAHWDIRRCATLFTEIDERGRPDFPLLHVSLNTGVTLRVFSDERIEAVAADFSTYKVARQNDLVFNKMRFWQGAGGISPADGLTSPDYTVARMGDALAPEYVELLVRLPMFSAEVRRYSYGMVDDRLRLYWDAFKNLRIPVPPVDEQKRIAAAATNEAREIAELGSLMARSITLASERRAALITAAVTGRVPMGEKTG